MALPAQQNIGVQSAWPPEHITGGNARGIPRAIGRGSPLITAAAPENMLGAAAKFSVGHASFASFTFGEAECGTCII